jgi:hypothetical protein
MYIYVNWKTLISKTKVDEAEEEVAENIFSAYAKLKYEKEREAE